MEENYLKYDEEEALAFIRKYIPNTVSEQYSNDEILFIIDTVWDYYESKGIVRLEPKLTDNQIENVDNLVDYVRKEVKKDGEILMDPADIEYIVKGELAYEKSIEIFND